MTLHVPLEKKPQLTESGEQVREVQAPSEREQIQVNIEEKIKVLLVDDHQMVREGLRNIIENQSDLLVIGEASDGKEAIECTKKTSPDVILMDVSMPGMDGIEATQKITSEHPNIRIIGVSLHDESGVAEDMRNAGASAFLTKTEAFKSLSTTIRAEASALKG